MRTRGVPAAAGRTPGFAVSSDGGETVHAFLCSDAGGGIRTVSRSSYSPHSVHPGDALWANDMDGTVTWVWREGDQPMFFTCYHCVRPHYASWEEYAAIPSLPGLVFNPERDVLGVIEQGLRTTTLDLAVVSSEHDGENVIPETGQYLSAPVTDLIPQVGDLLRCRLGKQRRVVTCSVAALNGTESLPYDDGRWKLYDLMHIVSIEDPPGPVAIEGDSGSPVYDEDGRFVGMIVGTSINCSYVIPAANIDKQLRSFGYIHHFGV